jgi:phosphohistidine phosphatase
MGELLAELRMIPDLSLSSTAKRARTTAAKVAEACGYQRSVELRDELYQVAPSTCITVLREVYYDEPCVMLVAHNPGLEELLELLTGVSEPLPTAALAQITLPIDSWRDLTSGVDGTLANLWRPRELE